MDITKDFIRELDELNIQHLLYEEYGTYNIDTYDEDIDYEYREILVQEKLKDIFE